MTDEERAIWSAAYSAAFVDDYERLRRVAESIPSSQRHGELPSDSQRRVVSAEWACYIADLAVKKLRQWRTDENQSAGVSIEEEL